MARLRGVGYTTSDWADGSLMKTHQVAGGYQGPAHKKFSNYEFDPAEFVRIMLGIRDKVIMDVRYRKAFSLLKEEL